MAQPVIVPQPESQLDPHITDALVDAGASAARREAYILQLIEAHRSYARAIATNVLKKLPSSVDKEDLHGAAELGLVEAAQAYDPRRAVLFKTFAFYRIQGAVYDAIRKMSWYSRTAYQELKFGMAANEYMKDYSEAPPAAGSGSEQILEAQSQIGAIATAYMLSLDEPGAATPADTRKSAETAAIENQDGARLREALTKLPEKNRRVIEGYYFENANLEELGDRLGLSKSWMCRVHAKSLEMLRDLLATPLLEKKQATSPRLSR